MKDILLTGADRFIGGKFASAYKTKYNIVAPISIDYTNYEQVEKLFADHNFCAVIHAYGKRNAFNREQLSADSVIAFNHIQHLCVLKGVPKLLVISDASDLDAGEGVNAATEEYLGQSIPNRGYGVERYLISSLALKDKISTVLRFFDVYGGGASAQNGMPMGALGRAILGKKTVELNADKTFSTIYIDDACKIISLFIDKDYPCGAYNVCSPTPVTLYDFAKKAKNLARKEGREFTLILGDGDDYPLTGDCTKLLDTIGPFKFTAFNTGINKTIEYCKAHKSCLRDPNDD